MAFSNPRASGRPVAIKDEGVVIASNVASIDFAGAGVSGVAAGDDVTETISGGAGGNQIREDLTSQCNGSNKVFTLANAYVAGSVALFGTQFPLVYRPTTDFTESGAAQITLTAAVAAPETDQTLVAIYEKS